VELDIAHAWKDASYRQSLTSEQQALLPENPVGVYELTGAARGIVQGSSLGCEAFTAFGDNTISFAASSDREHNTCHTFGSMLRIANTSGQ
jgi:mersacidin/lichenicidin family type 2 lantibiotic